MKKVFPFALFLFSTLATWGADTLLVKSPQIPILIERHDNVLFYMRLTSTGTKVLDNISVNFAKDADINKIKSIKLYYAGTEALQDRNKGRFAPVKYISSNNPGKTLAANPSYSIKKSESEVVESTIKLDGKQKLYPGINYFWVSIEMKDDAPISTTLAASLISAEADGKPLPVKTVSGDTTVRRMGIGVRHAGDNGSAAFRIPGLVTTNKGTLLGVYDVRYNNSADLQEHIDIGLSRSTDGGRTWEKNAFAPVIWRIRRTALGAKRGWRPVDSSRYKNKYGLDCSSMDTRNGKPTCMVEFTTRHELKPYGTISHDKEYR